MMRFDELSTDRKRHIRIKIDRNRMMNTNETKNFKNNCKNSKRNLSKS